MKLKAVRLENYKKIEDTGWIDCEDLMVFVGKNEAGKTALFRGLSKLKPTDGVRYDGLKEFPHGRFTDEFDREDWPAASGRFDLDKREREALTEVCSALANVKSVTVTRYYSDDVEVEFHPQPKLSTVTREQWQQFLELNQKRVSEAVAPDGKGEEWSPIKAAVVKLLSSGVNQTKSDGFEVSLAMTNTLHQQISGHMNEQWAKDILKPVLDELDPIRSTLGQAATVTEGEAWVVEHMPYFLYFGRYEVLQSAIYLPEFVQRVQSNDKGPKTRVQNALFKHVGVDIADLASLGQHQHGQGENEEVRKKIDELDIKANSASIAMTEKFSDWWEQRRHKFTYKFHGDYFRVWVSDDLDPVDVELEERSLGMQYFFSFYLLFLVEAMEEHRNCILLLDEPGLHLHGTAQEKLIRFFEKLSKDNQLFYTTHSPFMVDGAHLERARAVYETAAGTLVSADVWPRDRDTLFPLQAALGYSVCQTLFLSRKQVLVEGLTDYMLLGVINEHLRCQDRPALDDDVVLIPMGGTTNLAPLASMLVGHNVDVAILLDSDKAGDRAIEKLRNVIGDIDARCVRIADAVGDQDTEEMEQLFPEDYYLSSVARAYPDVKLQFSSKEKKITNVVDRVKAFFDRKGLGRFEKWRPIEQVVRDIGQGADGVPSELFDSASKVLTACNAALGTVSAAEASTGNDTTK
jgi:hypothetical protein